MKLTTEFNTYDMTFRLTDSFGDTQYVAVLDYGMMRFEENLTVAVEEIVRRASGNTVTFERAWE